MERLKRPGAGFTLLELLIATVLFTVVLLAGSSLLINFGTFSSNLVRSEASLMGTALGAFEQIVKRIGESNQVVINPAGFPASGASIAIRVPPVGAATSDRTNDVFHVYWVAGGQLFHKSATGALPAVPAPGDTVIANDILATSSFSMVGGTLNQVRVTLNASTKPGMARGGAEEHLQTIAVARSIRA